MKNILESIIVNLIDNKDELKIEEKIDGDNIIYEVKVAAGEMGKVIGKQGRIAKSIRTIMKSVSSKERKRVTIEFVD